MSSTVEHPPVSRRPRSRRTRLILRSIVAVLVVALIVLVTWAIMNALTDDSPDRPTVTATAGDTTVHVAPYEYCNPRKPTECDAPGKTVELPVTAATPLVITVPDAIAKAPWSLKKYYVNPGVKDSDDNALIPEPQIFAPGSTSTVTVDPVDPSGKVLAGVEITLPTGIVDQDTGEITYIDHATWSIRTR